MCMCTYILLLLRTVGEARCVEALVVVTGALINVQYIPKKRITVIYHRLWPFSLPINIDISSIDVPTKRSQDRY